MWRFLTAIGLFVTLGGCSDPSLTCESSITTASGCKAPASKYIVSSNNNQFSQDKLCLTRFVFFPQKSAKVI
jgi:hypothetical protein